MSEAPLHLELAGVSLRYGEVRALQQVNLKVPSGQVVALIGANGAGKSSALRAITGLRNVAEGEVRLNGTVINAPGKQVGAHALVRLAGVNYLVRSTTTILAGRARGSCR